MSKINLSIVIPVYNEQEILNQCYVELLKVFGKDDEGVEFIFIDDGSKDKSSLIMRELAVLDKRVKSIFLSRNFGKEAAMSAGINFANGDFVAQIDADLQDPPEIIPTMIRHAQNNNYDVVYGVCQERKGESFFKKTTSFLFYKIINKMSDIDIPQNTGDFRVMRREVVLALKALPETQRFMKGLFPWIGFNQVGFAYHRKERTAGVTKFNFVKMWKHAVEGITSFTNIPLVFATYFGVAISFMSFLLIIFYILKYFLYGIRMEGFLTIIVAVLFIGGIQIMFLGIIGEYLGRTYLESKRRPVYLIKEKINISDEN